MDIKEFIEKTIPKSEDIVTWIPMSCGDSIAITNKKQIKCFKTNHYNQVSLAYTLIETREKLDPKYNTLSTQELIELKKKQSVTIDIETALLSVSGDTDSCSPYLEKYGYGAGLGQPIQTLFHECTLLYNKDVKHSGHTDLETFLKFYRDYPNAFPDNLIFYHLSCRNTFEESKNRVLEVMQTYFDNYLPTQKEFNVYLIYDGQIELIKNKKPYEKPSYQCEYDGYSADYHCSYYDENP